MMHTSAMVPPYGPAGTSRAFHQRIVEPLSARNMRPLRIPDPCPLPRSFAKFRGRPSFATPLIGFGAHGARPHIYPVVTVGGPCWTRFALHILATIANDPLFEIIRTTLAINSCTSPRSHIGTSSVPSPTTMGADPASAFFLRRRPQSPALHRHFSYLLLPRHEAFSILSLSSARTISCSVPILLFIIQRSVNTLIIILPLHPRAPSAVCIHQMSPIPQTPAYPHHSWRSLPRKSSCCRIGQTSVCNLQV